MPLELIPRLLIIFLGSPTTLEPKRKDVGQEAVCLWYRVTSSDRVCAFPENFTVTVTESPHLGRSDLDEVVPVLACQHETIQPSGSM